MSHFIDGQTEPGRPTCQGSPRCHPTSKFTTWGEMGHHRESSGCIRLWGWRGCVCRGPRHFHPNRGCLGEPQDTPIKMFLPWAQEQLHVNANLQTFWFPGVGENVSILPANSWSIWGPVLKLEATGMRWCRVHFCSPDSLPVVCEACADGYFGK